MKPFDVLNLSFTQSWVQPFPLILHISPLLVGAVNTAASNSLMSSSKNSHRLKFMTLQRPETLSNFFFFMQWT
jgi:hypothetical protein